MTFAEALRAVARDGRPIDWDSWYPLAQAAADDPQTLVDAVGALGSEDQYGLLDQLKADGGPLSDFLIVTLAANHAAFSDDQVRAYALVDSAEALARRQEHLARLAAATRGVTDQLAERRRAGFDLASEITGLEQRRNELRAEQLENGYLEMSAIEWDIARLEVLRTRLDGYDPVERRSRRDALLTATEHLKNERRLVEDEVAKAIRLRDEAEARLLEQQDALARAQSEHRDLESRHEGLSARIGELAQSVAELQAAYADRFEQSTALQDEEVRLRSVLEAEARRLAHLQTSPVAAEATRLRDEIRSLYRNLPDDDADAMFRSPASKRSNR